MRINDSLPRIEEDIGTLLREEMDLAQEGQMKFEALNQTLTNSGFTISEEDGRIVLHREVEGREVFVSWDPTAAPAADVDLNETDATEEDFQAISDALKKEQEGALEEGALSDGEHSMEEEEEEDAFSDSEKVMSDIDVEVRVVQDGKELVAQCAVAEDGLLYIYRLSDSARDIEVDLESMSRNLQHRMYDYLDSLGVGDSAAAFVQRYNAQYQVVKKLPAIEFLESYFTRD